MKYGCHKTTWIMHAERQNCPKKHRNTVFSKFGVGGDFTGNYRFKKFLYGLPQIPTVFQEHIDKALEFRTPVWLDDIICVTNGTTED